MTSLVIVNPHAASGRALRVWSQIESLMWEKLGDLIVAITERTEEVAAHLEEAMNVGVEQVITVGGDGTNHAIINALAVIAQANPGQALPIVGNLPIGTGRDWARTIGTPFVPLEAVHWLAKATPHPVDLGQLTHRQGESYFLNIASAGIGGEVDRRVNAVQQRRPWTFLAQTVFALLRYHPRQITVHVDGDMWYQGQAFLVAVANGRAFGHGMLIAPDAQVDDGLFDVILVEAMGVPTALRALPSLYDGSHLKRADVHHARAREVLIESPGGPLDLDLDGEYNIGESLHFTMQPRLLQMLRAPLNQAQPQPR